MKKLFAFLLLAILALNVSFAQQDPSQQRIPNDPNMRIGKLDNGMTYYIQKNQKPKNAANFYIVNNVGAVQELKDEQNGLAHFLEHMAFNGTKHFPGKALLEYLQANGMQFGRNINASTGMDVTQYFISEIPTDKRPGLVDSALLIIYDWAHNIALDHKEIDEERGVIMEELRTGNSADRMFINELYKSIGKGTMYEKRNVIGTLDNLKSFKYSDIEEFYQSWYHPGYQAVVVVGDFDPDEMEAKVKKLFADIPKNEKALAKAENFIPDFPEDEVVIVSHPEQTRTSIWVLAPVNEAKVATNDRLSSEIREYMFSLIQTVLNERLSEIAKKENAPFLSANVGTGNIAAANEHRMEMLSPKEGRAYEAMEVMEQEINRLKRYGVNPQELNRAVQNLIKTNEKEYANRNDRMSSEIAYRAIANFTNNYSAKSPETEYQIAMSVLNNVTKDMVNSYIPMLFKDKHAKIMVNLPEKLKSSIEPEKLLAAYHAGLTKQVEPLVEEVIDTELVDKTTLTPAVIVSHAQDSFGSDMWILSNRAVVIFKKTDYKQDELLINVTRKGGWSLIDDADYKKARVAMSYLTSGMGGAGKYSASNLRKALAGKSAQAFYSISRNLNGLLVMGSSADAETMFQLVNLYLTQPRFEASEVEVFKNMTKENLKNGAADPKSLFQDSIALATADSPARSLLRSERVELIDQVTPVDMERYYKEIFTGAKGMKFIIVGNAPTAEIRKFAEQYIGSLPSGADEKWVDREEKSKSDVNKHFVVKQNDDKCSIMISISGQGIANKRDNMIAMNLLRDVLRLRYTKIVREEMGATYGVGNAGTINHGPVSTFNVMAQYDSNDKFITSTSKVIVDQIEKIAKEGPTAEEMNIVVQNAVKNYKNSQQQNSYWLGVLDSYYNLGVDNQTKYDQALAKTTAKDIQKMAQEVLKKGKKVSVIMSSAPISE